MNTRMTSKSWLVWGCSLLVAGLSGLSAAPAGTQDQKNLYEVRYMENPPYGVTAWAQSALVRDRKTGDDRFMDYNSEAARGLILDATAGRTYAKSDAAAARETRFWIVYNDKGLYLYIEAEEPLVRQLQDAILDPRSSGHHEAYEIFMVPALHNAPYYQIMTHPYSEVTEFYDWGMPHRDYRSLKGFTKIESLPLDKGIGTFVFIPWEAWYERVPLDGGTWRFSIIRWMPYGQAGGVTWGGQVHDTGNFGLLRFEKPTVAQKVEIGKRLLRVAWFRFLATASEASIFWEDPRMGDPEFFETTLSPVVEQYKALGESLGNADQWNADTIRKAYSSLGDWMEFRYKVEELRTQYLRKKFFP